LLARQDVWQKEPYAEATKVFHEKIRTADGIVMELKV
jgi:hypothetical protein